MNIMSHPYTTDFNRGRVIAYRDSGLTFKKIEEKTGVKTSTSQRLWDEWLTSEKSGPSEIPGRPTLHTPAQRRGILTDIDTNRLASSQSLGEQEGCSSATIRRIAAEDGLHRQVMRRAPIITDNTKHKRLQWVEDNINTDWHQVLWTDEVPLTIGKDPRRRWVTRRAGEAYSEGMTLPALPQGKQIMAWSVIGFNYKGHLIRFDLNARTPPLRYDLQRPFRETQRNGINGPKYAEWIVRGPLFEAVQAFTSMGRLPIVMEDNAPCHNNEYADRTRAELGLRRLLHPPNSPDLNPIENVWFDLQGRRLRELGSKSQ